jgi:YVTN family beta-propeller protein
VGDAAPIDAERRLLPELSAGGGRSAGAGAVRNPRLCVPPWFSGLLVTTAVTLAVSPPAIANGRFPRADLIVFDPSDAERLIVRTTFGLLVSNDGGRHFDWICEAALELEDQEDPMIAVTRSGSVVAATVDGLVVGGRNECGFRRVAALDGEIVPDLTLDRADPSHVLAFRVRASADGFDSQLWASNDEGETFSAVGGPLERQLLPLSIDLAPSEPSRVYLTARLPRDSDYASVLLRSDDSGTSFERRSVDGTSGGALAFLAGVSPLEAERLYLRIAAPDGTLLVISDDSGDSFSPVHAGTGSLLGFAISPEGDKIAFGGPNDGVWIANADGTDKQQRSALGVSCLGWSEQGLYACSDSTEDFGVGRSDDEGQTFERLLSFSELCGNTLCDPSSEVGRLCRGAWNAQGPRLGASCNVTAPASAGAAGGGGAASNPAQSGGGPGQSGCGFSGRAALDGAWLVSLAALLMCRHGSSARVAGLRSRSWAALVSVLTLACSDPAEIEPYAGPPAYPNQRATFAAEGRRLAYVSNSLSDTIGVLDLDAFAVVAEVPVGRDPVDTDGPHHLAIDRERGLLYVALSYPNSLLDFGPHLHGMSEKFGYTERLALDDLRPLGEARVDVSPGDIALSPSGERLVVSHYDLVRAVAETFLEERRASLIWFEPAANLGHESARESRLVVCVAPHAVVFSRDERRLFVACTGEDALAVVDLEGREVLARVPVADSIGQPGSPIHQPYALVADAAVERLVVTNLDSKTVSLFSVDELPERTWTTPLLGSPYFPAWLDAQRLLVPLQSPSGAVILDAESGELVLEASYGAADCESPHEAVVSSDGRVFLVCEGDRVEAGAIVELDPETLAVEQRLDVGVYPDRLVLLDP